MRRRGSLVAGFLGICRSFFAILSVPVCDRKAAGGTTTKVLLAPDLNTIVKD
jgi:hypothetical protein